MTVGITIGIMITTGITIGVAIIIGSHCCATIISVMQVAYLLGRTRQTDRDEPMRCASLTLEREEHLRIAVISFLWEKLKKLYYIAGHCGNTNVTFDFVRCDNSL
jgi:hypothetical protein